MRGGKHTDVCEEFSRLRPSLLRIAARITGSAADAEDVVQNVSIRLLERPQYGAPLRPWLRVVTRHEAIDAWRRAKGRREVSWLEDTVAAETAEAEHPTRCGDELARALQQLPSCMRVAIALRFDEALSYDEIARRLHVPQRTVATRLHRAKASVRLLLHAQLSGKKPRSRASLVRASDEAHRATVTPGVRS